MPALKKSADIAELDGPALSRRVLIKVRRDQTTETARIVWAHEIPILQIIFGEGEIREEDPASMDEGYRPKVSADMMPHNKRQDHINPPSESAGLGWVFVGSPEVEYERLCSAYGKHSEVNQPNAEYVYGRLSAGRFKAMLGRPRLEDLPEPQLRDMILNFGHPLPVATKDSTPAEAAEAAKAWADFRSMPKAGLVKLAAETGVELG